MSGISDLQVLLKTLNPIVQSGEYAFAVVDAPQAHQIKPLMIFKEEEGTTIIVRKEVADRLCISYDLTWKLITLTVHSDLQAVGLLALVCGKLASAGISVNAVSAFYHDHLFVRPERAEEALAIIQALTLEQ